MQAHTDSLIGLVSYRSQIEVLFQTTTAHKLYAQINELVYIVGKRNLENLARVQETLVMFAQAEEVNLLILLIPIPTDALETASAIGKTMGAYRNDTLLGGYELAVHKKFFC